MRKHTTHFIEKLASEVHDLYQNEVKRQGRTLRHEDDYANLSEETKELDRVFVRWHLSRLAHLSAVNEKQTSILKQLIEEGCCWEPECETRLEGVVTETEIPCEKCPYCRSVKLADEMGDAQRAHEEIDDSSDAVTGCGDK